ncbi:MAG: TonB family protein [Myxococcota bacterium]
MRSTRRNQPGWRRWGLPVVLALALQIPLLDGFTSYLSAEKPTVQRKTRMKLVGAKRAPTKPPEPEVILPDDARIVEVPDLVQPEPDETVETRNVADRTVNVDRETKSKRRGRQERAKRPGKVKPTERSAVQSESSDSAEPSASEQSQKKAASAKQAERRPEHAEGQQAKRNLSEQGVDSDLMMPVTTRKQRLAQVQGMSGSFASDSYLPDVAEEAEDTILRSNKYKYADFFYRVKEAVRRHWHPDRVYRQRDPTGRVFGVKDRYTVLKVTIDEAGYLRDLLATKDSGLDFLDAEALSAFRRAQPFPNPPDGLVDDLGKIVFQFGFYFEITSGKQRFQWKRL